MELFGAFLSAASRFASWRTHALWRLERVPYLGFQ